MVVKEYKLGLKVCKMKMKECKFGMKECKMGIKVAGLIRALVHIGSLTN